MSDGSSHAKASYTRRHSSLPGPIATGLAGSAGKSSQIVIAAVAAPSASSSPFLAAVRLLASSWPLLVWKAMAAWEGTRPVVHSACAAASVACPQLSVCEMDGVYVGGSMVQAINGGEMAPT